MGYMTDGSQGYWSSREIFAVELNIQANGPMSKKLHLLYILLNSIWARQACLLDKL